MIMVIESESCTTEIQVNVYTQHMLCKHEKDIIKE